MKSSIYLLLFLISCTSFGQNEKIRDFVSQTFFGYDITKKPEKIEKETERPLFDYSEKSNERYKEKNTIKFNYHPLVKGEMDGQYNITYLYSKKELFDNYGIYKLEMTLVFKNYKPCKEMLDRLKRICRETSEFKNEKIGRENAPKSEECVYNFDAKLQMPRIEISYQRGPHTIRIQVYTSYNFNMFKKYKDKIW